MAAPVRLWTPWRWKATGVYWLPAYQHLEAAGFEVLLVDARSEIRARAQE